MVTQEVVRFGTARIKADITVRRREVSEEEEEEVTPVQGCMDRTGQTTSVRTDTAGFRPGRIKQAVTTITFPEACQQIITGEDITRRSTITKKALTTHTRIRGTIRSRI